jgi:hypothetical protein
MRIYLAAGFSILNVKGKEEELFKLMSGRGYSYNRLLSYFSYINNNAKHTEDTIRLGGRVDGI